MTGTAPLSVAAQTNPIFNPGYYLNNYSQQTNSHVFTEAVRNPGVRGVFSQYAWKELHTGVDTFDWTRIDAEIALLQGKQLYLYVEVINFGAPHRSEMPEHVQASAIYGGGKTNAGLGSFGSYVTTANSANFAAFWDADLQGAWTEFVTALADRYANNVNFEGLCLSETANRVPHDDYGYGTAEKTARKQYYYDCMYEAAALFPRHSVIQQVNWSGWCGLNRDDLMDQVLANNAANPGRSGSFGTIDSSYHFNSPGSLGPIFDHIQAIGDDVPTMSKLEFATATEKNEEAGYSIAQMIDYFNVELNPWYYMHAYSNQTVARRAEVAAKMELDGGTPRSIAYEDGEIIPPDPPPGPTPSEITGISVETATDWGTSIDITIPSSATEGRLMVAIMGMRATSASTAYTSADAGWDKLLDYWDAATDRIVGIYTRVATATEATSVNISGNASGSYISGMVRVFEGVHADIVDVTSVVSTELNNNSPTNSPITTTTDKCLTLLVVAQSNDPITATGVPTGYTEAATIGYGGANLLLAEKEVSPLGLETPGAWSNTSTSPTASDNVLATLALKPAAGAVLPIAWDTIPDQETHPGQQGYTFHTAPYITAGTGDGTAIAYSLTSTPAGFAIDSATGIIMIEGAASGNYPLEVTATDDSDAASTTFNIVLTVDAVDMVISEGTVTPSTTSLSIGVGAGMAYGTFWCSISETVAYDANSAARIVDAGHADNDQTKSLTGDTQLPVFTFTGLTPGQQYHYGTVQEASD